jgi:predicted RNase H-like HicB family nuclease
MGAIVYRVHADWDPEAKVWVATSDDVPGLATEALTVEALAENLRIMIPELVEANQLLSGDQPDAIAFELTSHRQEKVRLTEEYLRAKLDELFQSWIQKGDAQ